MYIMSFIALVVTFGMLALAGGGPSQDFVAAEKVTHFTKLSRYAFISYYPDSESIKTWTCLLCKDPSLSGTTNIITTESKDNSTRGYVAVNPALKTIIVSIRGSASVEDFVANLNILQRPLAVPDAPSNALVHAGFSDRWQLLRPSVTAALNSALKLYPKFSAAFVGHSLGAAVDLAVSLQIPASRVHIVNMGQPRVGNKEFGLYVNSRGFAQVSRIVNYNDIVPHYPPRAAGYQQQSTEYWLNREGRLVNCKDNEGEDINCSNTVRDFSIPNHFVYFGIAIPVF
ncbi:Alpha/Beta hydrolase protein [Obelidium mucronatum]|nr:Alpha/Beta hydrolase protein [Obelidium mucronatum]